MTIKTLTLILLATSILLFTACDSKTTTETAQTQNPIAQPIEETSTAGGDDITTGGTTQNGGSTAGGASGSDDNTTTGGGGANNDNTTTNPTSSITLVSLNLIVDKTILNKDEATTVKVMATYSDNTSKEVTDKVEWIVVPNDSVKVTNAILTALKDKATTVKVKLANKTSDAISLNITWIVNGHVLPPEPDKILNDSTLLGIDVNDNGVRDDVERWIYEEYKDKHPIHIDIGMQAGRAYKLVLETPERAKEIRGEVNGALFCTSYYKFGAQLFNDPILVHERIDAPVMSKYFNTKERNNIYWQYDTLLSGGVYPLPEYDKRKSLCDFNTSKYDKE